MAQDFYGSSGLGQALAGIAPLRVLDLGARGLPATDLLPLAPALDVVALEADEQECQRLQQEYAPASPFYHLSFYPRAIGPHAENRTLYLTEHRGASSLLPPLKEIGQAFLRPEYVNVQEYQHITTTGINRFQTQEDLGPIHMLRMDIEGLEKMALETATDLLQQQLLGIQTEVAFLPTRSQQPTCGDIELLLRPQGFVPMGFTELHHWRRLSRRRWPRKDQGLVPYSRGQLAHADMLFLRDMPQMLKLDEQSCLRGAFLAMNYGYFDHAYVLLRESGAGRSLEVEYDIKLEDEFKKASKTYFKRVVKGKKK